MYLLIILTILGEVFSIYMFATDSSVNPESGFGPRDGLVVDWEIAALNAAIMIPLNLLALFLIFKRKEYSPLFFIAISVGNRIWSQFIYDSGMHGMFIGWTGLLIYFTYWAHYKTNPIELISILAGAITGAVAFYFTFWATINEIIATIVWVLIIAAFVGLAKLINKNRKG